MPSFEQMFQREVNGKIEVCRSVDFEGDQVFLWDELDVSGCPRLRFTFLGTASKWRQGVRLSTRRDGECLIVNEHRIDHPRSLVLWSDTAPEAVEIELIGRPESQVVVNVWDTGNGVTQTGHNGAAMKIRETPAGRRYDCNDGFPDSDFDDLVFQIDRC